MNKKYILIEEWLGDSYKVCGVYESTKDFIPEMIKHIECDGSLKVIRHYTEHNKLNIYVESTKNSKEKYTDVFLITNIELNTIIL